VRQEFGSLNEACVARCRACGEMLLVLVTIRGITCVDLRGIAESRGA
jgi:hypothetical protein